MPKYIYHVEELEALAPEGVSSDVQLEVASALTSQPNMWVGRT